jgi:hypothetical protein
MGNSESIALGSQKTIDFSTAHKQQVDMLFGMAIFAGARPFLLVEDKQMKHYIHTLNPRYHIPSRTTVSKSLLADCYRATSDQSNTVLARYRDVNLSVDESTNIRKRHIMNMSLTNSETLYH